MFKLTKNLSIQGIWIFRIQEGGFDKDGGKIQGGWDPRRSYVFCQYLIF